MNIVENNSQKILILNLEKYYNEYNSYEKLASFLGVSTNTLKSWMLGTRTPKLARIDYIANKLGCHSSDLINNLEIIRNGFDNNKSQENFVKNLNIIFIENQCFSMPQKLNLLNNVITDFALNSYLRSTNFRTPTIAKLDLIANQLDIKTFELIKEIE